MGKKFRLFLPACFFSLLVILPMPSFAYQEDAVNHTLTVSPSSSITQTTADLQNALNFLVSRPDKTTAWTVRLNPGKYILSRQITTIGLQNTTIRSANTANPAQLVKMPGWDSATSAEYVLYNVMGKNINLIGIQFFGLTNFAANDNPNWPDQGVYFGSCDTVKIDQNKFFNFGNSALRVSTWERDPSPGVHSFNTRVTNNLFNNVYQISTTVQDNVHGGTSHYLMQNNAFVNLRGSVKFASRTPGATDIHVTTNLFNGCDHFGLEINNYQNFEVNGNTFENIKDVSLNIYTAAGIPGFTWGDNFSIINNTFKNVSRGIRYSHEVAENGFQNVPRNLIISNNSLSTVTNAAKNVPAILVENDTFNGVSISKNKMYAIASKNYISVAKGSTSVSILDNFVNGTAFGLQTANALK